MGCAHSLSPTAQESSETGMTTRSEARLLCKQLGREVRNAALSITDTSSCSRETPCLRGLISILMSCSEAQLGLPTPAGHSHSFTCNYHQTQGAPFPHPQPPPQAWTCTDFQRLQQYPVLTLQSAKLRDRRCHSARPENHGKTTWGRQESQLPDCSQESKSPLEQRRAGWDQEVGNTLQAQFHGHIAPRRAAA